MFYRLLLLTAANFLFSAAIMHMLPSQLRGNHILEGHESLAGPFYDQPGFLSLAAFG